MKHSYAVDIDKKGLIRNFKRKPIHVIFDWLMKLVLRFNLGKIGDISLLKDHYDIS